MFESFEMDKASRNLYMRYTINLLVNKYHINLAALAKDAGFLYGNLYSFSKNTRQFGVKNLDKLEYYIMDLYGGLLSFELPDTRFKYKRLVESLAEENE